MAVNWKARCSPNILQSQRQKLLLLYRARVACRMPGSRDDEASSGFDWGGLVAREAFVEPFSLL